jgi:hypothetical protein
MMILAILATTAVWAWGASAPAGLAYYRFKRCLVGTLGVCLLFLIAQAGGLA